MALNGGEATAEIIWVMKVGIRLGENRCETRWIGYEIPLLPF